LAALLAAAAAVVSRTGAAAGLAVLILGCVGATAAWPNRFRPTLGDKLGSRMDLSRPLFERWNALSYVVAPPFERTERPFLWSTPTTALTGNFEESLALIDGDAATPLVGYRTLDDVRYLRQDVTAAAHWLRPDGTACVMGVGGGRDVLAALEAGHPRVIAAEINPSMVRLVNAISAQSPVGIDPRVTLVAEDGRQRFGTATGECRVLQASLVDTWAATGAGAFAHSEATLYTREAWAGFLRAVEPDGVLTFSRWYSPTDVDETSRLVALALASLFDRGVAHPREHLALVSGGRIATLLVSPAPLSAADVSQLKAVAAREQRPLLISPDTVAASPLLEQLLTAPNAGALAAVGEPVGLNTAPSSDDSPFFFQILRGRRWLEWDREPGVARGNAVAAAVLGLTFVVLALLTALFLLPTLASRTRRGAAFEGRTTVYFGALGAGFMLAEVALVQRMHLVLAHPTLALVFVLAGLLAAMGCGSIASTRLLTTRRRVAAACLLAALALAVLPRGVIHPLAVWSAGASLPVRAAWTSATAACLGVILGTLFPSGLRFLGEPQAVPLAFAVNGAAGVLGGLVAIVVSVLAGIPQSFYLAAVVYAVAAAASPPFWRGAASQA
jgi:hypothetical protein